MSKTTLVDQWVLRCAITGDIFAVSREEPPDVGYPVSWDFRECYWGFEPFPSTNATAEGDHP